MHSLRIISVSVRRQSTGSCGRGRYRECLRSDLSGELQERVFYGSRGNGLKILFFCVQQCPKILFSLFFDNSILIYFFVDTTYYIVAINLKQKGGINLRVTSPPAFTFGKTLLQKRFTRGVHFPAVAVNFNRYGPRQPAGTVVATLA